ncbi:MAG: SPFH domain-containing protein [Legionellales bacterium]|nr:SPFH domain-containing protein [Legionellales bacterium]
MIIWGIILAVIIVLLSLTFFTVEQQSAAVVERFGKFVRIAQAGLNFKIPFVEHIRGFISLRVRQLDVPVETKTQDNVFVRVAVSVQFHALPDNIYAAFYRLENTEQQVTSFVFDVVRARVPKMNLDDVFEKKDEIANAVQTELCEVMSNFGYAIVKALVTDIEPDQKVKAAMNEINEAQRLRIAATERGEAEKILKVKAAEAEAASKALQGKGIAEQRRAIVDGLRDSVGGFQKEIPGTTTQDILSLVLMTQYFDTLRDVGVSSRSNTILIPHGPGVVQDLSEALRTAMITANEVTKHQVDAEK